MNKRETERRSTAQVWAQGAVAAFLAMGLNTFGATTAAATDATPLRTGTTSTKAPMAPPLLAAPAAVKSAVSATEVITTIQWAMPGSPAYVCMSNPATAEAVLWAGKYKTPIKRPSFNPWFQTPSVCADSDTAETIVPMITSTELLGNAFAVIYPGDVITASDPVSLPLPTQYTYYNPTRQLWLRDGKWRAFYGPYLGEATEVSVNGTVLSSSDYRIVGPGLLMTKVMTDFNVSATTRITTPYGVLQNTSNGLNHSLENEMWTLAPGYVGKTNVNPSGLIEDSANTVLTDDGRKTSREIRPWDDQDWGSNLWLRTSPTAPAVAVNSFYVESSSTWMTGQGDRTKGWISSGMQLVAPNTILSTGWFTSAQTDRRIEYSARTAIEAMSQEVRTTYTFSDPLGIGMLEMIPTANFYDFGSYKNKSLVFVGDPARQGGFAHLVDDRFDRGWGMGYQLTPGVAWNGFALERTYVQIRAGALVTGGQIENNTAYFTTSVQLGASTTITDAANVYNGNGSLSYSFSQQPTDEWYGGYRYNYGDVVHQPQSKLELSYSYSSTNPEATVISFTHRMRLQWDAPPSFDAMLSGLTITPGVLSPAFVSTTLAYTAEVANDVASTLVTPALSDPNAIYTITGMTGVCTPAMSPANCALSVGMNIISVTVTAEDGVTTEEYVLSIRRLRGPDASLMALDIEPGDLSPAFVSTTLNYQTVVPDGTTSAVVTATTSDVSATIAYASTAGACVGATGPVAHTCDIASSGTTTITITITTPDLTTTKIYTTVVTVADANASSDASLMALDIEPGELSPAFVSTTTSYTTEVPSGTTSAVVTATTNDVSATIAYASTAGACVGATGPVAPTCDIASSGTTTITVTITAADGTTQEYVIVVTVMTFEGPHIAELAIDIPGLTPAFVSTTLQYQTEVPSGTNQLVVTPTLSISATAAYSSTAGACVDSGVSGTCPLFPTETTTVTIDITDGTTTRNYTIRATRAAAPGSVRKYWFPVVPVLK
jgi:hypothetical protein